MRQPPPFVLDYGAATDAGHARELNEDSMYVGSGLFVVADGMGGHAAGEVASAVALNRFVPIAQRPDLRAGDLVAAIDTANAAILEVAARHTQTKGMGTTLSGIYLGTFLGSPHWYVFNVGDSRVYRYADGALTQETVDHSEVQELVTAGRITALQARSHPRRNVVTRSLGTDPPPVPDVRVLPAVSGETLMICSDGLPLEVDDVDILTALDSASSAQELADRLCAMALRAGGRDNVTVIVVRLAEAAPDRPDGPTLPRSLIVRPA